MQYIKQNYETQSSELNRKVNRRADSLYKYQLQNKCNGQGF